MNISRIYDSSLNRPLQGPKLFTMWFGESEANVCAAALPVMFFDELYSTAKARGGGGDDAGGASDCGSTRSYRTSKMDHMNSMFIIGAANKPMLYTFSN